MTPDHGQNAGPLESAMEAQKRAALAGFDWADIWGVFDKLDEEIAEIRSALEAEDAASARRELGDLLFTVVNLARFLNANPSGELEVATATFSTRFLHMQTELKRSNRSVEDCSPDELDLVWEQVKKSVALQQKKA